MRLNHPGAGRALEGVIGSTRQLSIHKFENVSQNFRHSTVEMGWDLLADIH
jgi:hypothetical protein